MVAASLVLNLRYKALDDGAALYIDTWTGKTHTAGVVVPPAPALVAEAPKRPAANGRADILILERLERLQERHVHRHRIEVEKLEHDCTAIRFAFPAPVVEYRR
jgi:hypothetical protein